MCAEDRPGHPADMSNDIDDDRTTPPATWFRDDHCTGPVPPLQWGIWNEHMDAGFAASMARYGLPVVGLQYLRHRGWVFTRFAPLTDPAAVGDRCATRQALTERAEAEATARWLRDDLPAWAARRRALRDGAADLADDEVADRLEAAAAGLAGLVAARFGDIAVTGQLGRWVNTACDLGWDEATATAAVSGAATAATSLLRAVRSSADSDHLLAEHGDLLLGTDVLAPTLSERPDLLAAVDPGALATPHDRPADPELPPHAAAALDDARLLLRWREATHDELAAWLGALRLLALETGRRLHTRGDLVEPELALFLTADDLVAGLRREGAGLSARAEAQRDAHQRAVDDPPPPLLGPPPEGPPPEGPRLPPVVAVALADFAWVGERMGTPPGPPAVADGAVTGVGASAGVVEGPVRVVLDLDQVGDIEPGEVLVCPMTAPGWDLAFALAAAVVTDGGGLVSHSALLAREVGIPAVVGTKVGTAVLRTGQRVVVDGTTGTVTPVA